jgi:hypothetical protein
MRVAGATIACCLLLATPSHAGNNGRKVIDAVRTTRPPDVDGWLNDPCWCVAKPVTDFVQFDPIEGAAPSETTIVSLLYDDDALYVGVMCSDSDPRGIVHRLSRRDRTTEADRFTVMIDSYMDHQTGFVFSTNVSGVQSDGILSQGGTVYDITWDAVWTVRTRHYRGGWSAEFAIPWNALRFAKDAYHWGINFRRYISRKKETVEWVMVPRSETYAIPLWGIVDGVNGIQPPLHLEIAPYVSVTRTMTTGHTATGAPSGEVFDAGADLKYGVSRNFTLDATINPDFGQVEVDQSVLNLTIFETRFPEKRPFFVEGAQMFTFGGSVDNTPLTLFFTRRLGRQPRFASTMLYAYGNMLQENPQLTTILGAVKVTGRTADGLSVAALSSLTDEEHAVVAPPGGDSFRVRTEPRGTYHVARVKQEWQDGSWLGGMATLAALNGAKSAISGGVDWNVRMFDGLYTVDGYLAGAHATSGDGGAGRLLLSRLSAEHWFTTASYDFYGKGFNPNDLGFFAQPHDHGGYAQFVYRENASEGMFRRYFLALNPEMRWNWDGVRTHALARGEAIGEFDNFWLATLSLERAFPAYDDAEKGILGLYRRPGSSTVSLTVETDDRHALSALAMAGYTRDDGNSSTWYGHGSLTIRPSTWMELNPAIYYQRTKNEPAWVYPDGSVDDPAISASRFSVFGDRDLQLLDLSLRGIVTFTRTFSVQFFTQVFLARGMYDGYSRLLPSGFLTPYDYRSHPSYYGHDFNSVTLNANVLLRWEYLPGSTVYLVWTQARYGDNGLYSLGLKQGLRDVLQLPREDVVLLKASYWFSL